ncbi:MAG: MFS transporter, partial [Bacteroidia bacterium]|nr:MFS transporter [Bacteroidia bacterium]
MSSPYAVLQIRDFRFFIFARLFVTLGIQVQAVAVGLQVYAITKDPLSLGLIGLSEAIPSIAVSLYAGHIADIVQRKKIILVCVTMLSCCAFALIYFTTGVSSFILSYGAVPIYSVIFVTGIARGFLSPANFSFMPQLVDRHLYQNAVTWNSTTWEGASVAGPMIGGLVYGFFGITATYSVNTILMITGLICYLLITNRELPASSEEQGIYEKIKAGVNFVFKNQIVFAAILLDLLAVLFGGAIALLPIFAEEILKVGAVGFGFLRSAPAVGALTMAFFITHNPIKKNMGKILLWCVAGFGFCMIGFGLSRIFWLSMVFLI